MSARWKNLRYRIEAAACSAIAAALPLLPHPVLRAFARFAGALYFHFDRRTRKVALANLDCVFGDRKSPGEKMEIARASAENFALTFLELFWSGRLTLENYRDVMIPIGEEPLVSSIREKKGGIAVTIHAGNFEWVGIGFGFAGVRADQVAQDFKNPALESVFLRLRQISGQQMVPRRQSMLRMLKTVKRGGVAAFVCDLAMKLHEGGVVIDAFGMKMLVTPLHAVLHQRTGVPVTPVTSLHRADGMCELRIHEPVVIKAGATIHEITQQCWNFFEAWILEHPGDWLWGYKHFRYKPRGAESGYPFYSGASDAFEELLVAAEADVSSGERKGEG